MVDQAPAKVVPDPSNVALVLGGGGARGAYEIGALQVLLPWLKEEYRPSVILGTSIGAIHAAYLGAHAHQLTGTRPEEALEGAVKMWSTIEPDEVLPPLVSRSTISKVLGLARTVVRLGSEQVFELIETARLEDKLRRTITPADMDRIAANVANPKVPLKAVGVVGTLSPSSRSVVFVDRQGALPASDPYRGIQYARTKLNYDHILGSAAIPLVFPARQITEPDCAKGWYFDGGVRLNTPISPALKLGAKGVIVIAMSSLHIHKVQPHSQQPDIADGAAQILNAVLVDPLVQDMHTLADLNEQPGKETIPYIFIAPKDPTAIARLAWEVWDTKYGRERFAEMGLLGRALGAASESSEIGHGEVLSNLLFTSAFTKQLLEMGAEDATRWISEPHPPQGQFITDRIVMDPPPGPCYDEL